MVRLHYLDNLRWICILLLFPVHAAVVFSAGWFGYYVTSEYTSMAALILIVSTMPWLMPLLFCVAGMSTKFALEKRSPAVYLKERVVKLLVPYLAGLILLCPVLAYVGMRANAGYTGSFTGAFVYFFSTFNNVQDPTGFTGDFDSAHLWFILYLFIISVAALGVILLLKKQTRFSLKSRTVGLPLLILLVIPVGLLNAVGDGVSGYTLASYFAMFLIGYYLFSRDSVQETLEKYRVLLAGAWILLTVGMIVFAMGIPAGTLTLLDVISSPLSPLTGWIGVLALIGMGRHLFNGTNNFSAYLGAAAYPVYIIHQPILVAVAWYVLMLAISPAVQFALIVVTSLLLTFAGYECLKRIPVVRVLFGVTSPRKKTV